jgi:hypothetical protein
MLLPIELDYEPTATITRDAYKALIKRLPEDYKIDLFIGLFIHVGSAGCIQLLAK